MFKKFLVPLLVAFVFTFGMKSACADLLTGSDVFSEAYFHFINDKVNSGYRFASPIKGTNLTTGQSMTVFCADQYTPLSDNYMNPAIGQQYTGTTLVSSELFTDHQKTAVSSLFSHVYSSVFDAVTVKAPAALAFQLAVWEIMHETSGYWGITTGKFGIDQARDANGKLDTALYNEVTKLTNNWLAASLNESLWTGLGYGKTDLEVYVYVAEGGTHASQTILSTREPNRVETSETPEAITPEPASMLMAGIGLLAFPFARRVLRKK